MYKSWKILYTDFAVFILARPSILFRNLIQKDSEAGIFFFFSTSFVWFKHKFPPHTHNLRGRQSVCTDLEFCIILLQQKIAIWQFQEISLKIKYIFLNRLQIISSHFILMSLMTEQFYFSGQCCLHNKMLIPRIPILIIWIRPMIVQLCPQSVLLSKYKPTHFVWHFASYYKYMFYNHCSSLKGFCFYCKQMIHVFSKDCP